MTPAIAASNIPEIETDRFPYATDRAAPPRPKTSMAPVTTTFRVLLKSTWFWISILIPLTEIKPYNSSEIPPKTGWGIAEKVMSGDLKMQKGLQLPQQGKLHKQKRCLSFL